MISHRLIYVKSNLPKEVEMKQYKLFMDVSGDVLHEIAGDSVGLVPMEFIIDGKSYIYTDSDEGMNPIEFYQYVKQGIAIKTSQITPAFYENYFDETLKNGYSVLYLCLSSKLSSTYMSACHASETLKEKYPDVDFVPVDSLQATVGMGLLCEKMIENRNNGLPIEQNKESLLAARSHITTTGVVDDLNALKRGGRISATVAVIGGVLNFKPVIAVKEDGSLQMSTTTHGMRKALKYFVDLFTETHDENSKVVYIMHADEEKNSLALQDMLLQAFPDLQIRRRLLSPIIGAHLGKGLVGLAFYKK